MNSNDLYQAVEAAIKRRGFYAGLQPLCDDGGIRLVCASDGGDWGLGGVSFWVTWQAGRWFIASWAPNTYEVPAHVDVADVVIAALAAAIAHPARFYFDIDESVRSHFQLKSVDENEFDGLLENELK